MPRGDNVTALSTDVWTYKFPCQKIITAENDRTLHLKKKLHSKKCDYCCLHFVNVNTYETLQHKTRYNYKDGLNLPKQHQDNITKIMNF